MTLPTFGRPSSLAHSQRGLRIAATATSLLAIAIACGEASDTEADLPPDFTGTVQGAQPGVTGNQPTGTPQMGGQAADQSTEVQPAGSTGVQQASDQNNGAEGNTGNVGIDNSQTDNQNGGNQNGGNQNGGAGGGSMNDGAGGGAMDPVNGDGTPITPPMEDPVVEPPPPVERGGVFFSDSFEGGRQPEWEESLNGQGTFSIDSTQGANGTASSIRVDGGGFHTMLQYRFPEFVRENNQYFGRVHMRVEQAPQGHVTWIETGIATEEFGRGNDEFEVRIGYNLSVLDINRFPSDQEIRDPNTTITPNAWHCVQFFFDNEPEEARIWFDGEETALSTTDFTGQRPGAVDNNQQPQNDWVPPFEAIRFGWELNGNTIWFDEVVLSEAFVECQ